MLLGTDDTGLLIFKKATGQKISRLKPASQFRGVYFAKSTKYTNQIWQIAKSNLALVSLTSRMLFASQSLKLRP